MRFFLKEKQKVKSENQPLLIQEIKSGCSEISVQQVTQSVHQMKRDGIVIRFEEGALGYFALAQEGER